MRFRIDNIAKVKSADIKLNGLTVIAGENGSGKSTVGKMLFSVIQVLKSTHNNSVRKQHNDLLNYINRLYMRLNSCNLSTQAYIDSLPRSYQLGTQLLDGSLSVEQLRDMVESLLANVDNLTPRTRANIEKDINNISICVNRFNNRAAVQTASIQRIIESEFMNKVCSYGTDEARVSLDIDEDGGEANISFSIVNDKVKNVTSGGEEFLRDATYVESPLYLHMLESLRGSIQYIELGPRPSFRAMIPTHIKDFVEKMIYAKASLDLFEDYSTLLKEIEDKIHGSFSYDEESNKLFYYSNGNRFSPINTASGTKTFGVLQLLLQSHVIGTDRILLWDEPENHLHPEWQVAFAEIMLNMVAQGIPIVISTHSPYFIQAVRYYAAKCGLENSVDYYFAEEDESGFSTLEEVTGDLNRVFRKLSRPLSGVMDVDKIRKHE